MTLPSDYIFPLHPNEVQGTPQQLSEYVKELVVSIQDMYLDVATAINGEQKRYTDPVAQRWVPTVAGITTPGTYTYGFQYGFAQRVGLMTDCFFDVQWTASSGATGGLYIVLPYLVTQTEGIPFVGPIQSSQIDFAGGTVLTCIARSNTYRLEIFRSGSLIIMDTIDAATAPIGRLTGSIRYIGRQDGNGP